MEVLVDGETALPAMAQALRGARHEVLMAGWHASPDFALTRDDGAPPLRDLLAGLAERVPVRVLMWAGAPLPVFTPSRREVRRVRDAFVRGTRIELALDARERPMHCHHEKLIVVDGAVADECDSAVDDDELLASGPCTAITRSSSSSTALSHSSAAST